MAGCSGIVNGQPEPERPVESGGGQTGSSEPSDPGYSFAFGKVNQPDIIKIRVTWIDGKQAEASLVNSSYLFVRAGQGADHKVEGLNDQGNIVFPVE